MPGTPDEIAQDCLDAIKTAFATTAPPDEVAAVFVEPIQGDSGIIVPPGRFLTELSSLCAEHGILLVAEEVQTGIGRTGRWLAGEHFGIRPDIVLLGKALASGLPVSAIVARSELMDAWKAPGHVFCTGANPVCCAAALATLDVIEEEALLHNAEVRGAELRAGLLELQARHEVIGDVRGVGLLLGVDLVKDRSTRERATDLAPQVLLGCFRRGLFLTYLGKCVLRLVPPLIITSDDVARALEILDASLTDAVEGRIHPEETEAIVGW
jgi:4-aminobutyrate aminotransferase